MSETTLNCLIDEWGRPLVLLLGLALAAGAWWELLMWSVAGLR